MQRHFCLSELRLSFSSISNSLSSGNPANFTILCTYPRLVQHLEGATVPQTYNKEEKKEKKKLAFIGES